MLFPINFGIPKEKIDIINYEKTKVLSDLIPGTPSTYIYSTEEEYYNEYKKSYFAITLQKKGWDCMRHYEILANGCIPYFINIENCPKNTMTLLPKDLLCESNLLYEKKFKNKNIKELLAEDINEYNILRNKLLKYTQEYLTTEKVAAYILQKTNFDKVTKILYLSGYTQPDYLRCLVLHGLKNLSNIKCHDYPKIPHIYKSKYINYTNLYGKGFTYSNLLEPNLHDDYLNHTILENIKNKYYDIVIYGSYHRGMPFYNLITKIYKPDEIILLCGEDIHTCNYNYYLEKGHYIFVREL